MKELKFYLKLSADKFRSGLRKATRSVKTFQRKVTRSFASVGKAILSPLGLMAQFSIAMYKIGAAVTQGAKDFRKLQNEFANINTLLDKNNKLSADAKQRIVELSNTYGYDATENAKSYYDIVSGGIADEKQALDLLNQSNKLAIIGKGKLQTATSSLLTITNAYSKSQLSAKDAVDGYLAIIKVGRTTLNELAPTIGRIAQTAADAGISFHEFGATIAAATKSGQATSEVISGLRQVIGGLQKPTPQVAQAIKELGVEFNLSGIQAKSWTEIISELNNKLKHLSEAERLTIIGKLVEGKEAASIFGVVLKNYGSAIEDIKKSYKGLADESLVKVLATQENQLRKLQQEAKNLWAQRGFGDWVILWQRSKNYISSNVVEILKLVSSVYKFIESLKLTQGQIISLQTSLTALLGALTIFLPGGIIAKTLMLGATAFSAVGLGKTIGNQFKSKEQKQKEEEEATKLSQYREAEKSAQKSTYERYKELEKVKEKILELTQKSIDKIAEGVRKIREETERAIEKIKNTFFAGSAILRIAKVGKGLAEDDEASHIFRTLTDKFYDDKDLTPEIQEQLLEASKLAVKNNVDLREFIILMERLIGVGKSVKDYNPAQLMQALIKDPELLTRGLFDQNIDRGIANINERKRLGATQEKDFTETIKQETNKLIAQLLANTMKGKEIADIQKKSTDLFKQATEEFAKNSDKEVKVEIILKDDIKEFIETLTEKSNQNKTQNNKAYTGP